MGVELTEDENRAVAMVRTGSMYAQAAAATGVPAERIAALWGPNPDAVTTAPKSFYETQTGS